MHLSAKAFTMLRQKGRWLWLIVLIVGLVLVWPGKGRPPVALAKGPVSLSGRLVDPQGQPVRGAEVTVREGRGSEPIASTESQHNGTFVLDLPLRQFSAKLVVEVERPHFHPQEIALETEQVLQLDSGESLRLPDIELARRTTPGFWVAALVFLGVLGLIALEKLHTS
jgi:hypothetical protein